MREGAIEREGPRGIGIGEPTANRPGLPRRDDAHLYRSQRCTGRCGGGDTRGALHSEGCGGSTSKEHGRGVFESLTREHHLSPSRERSRQRSHLRDAQVLDVAIGPAQGASFPSSEDTHLHTVHCAASRDHGAQLRGRDSRAPGARESTEENPRLIREAGARQRHRVASRQWPALGRERAQGERLEPCEAALADREPSGILQGDARGPHRTGRRAQLEQGVVDHLEVPHGNSADLEHRALRGFRGAARHSEQVPAAPYRAPRSSAALPTRRQGSEDSRWRQHPCIRPSIRGPRIRTPCIPGALGSCVVIDSAIHAWAALATAAHEQAQEQQAQARMPAHGNSTWKV